jgi:hypothetical protein
MKVGSKVRLTINVTELPNSVNDWKIGNPITIPKVIEGSVVQDLGQQRWLVRTGFGDFAIHESQGVEL